MMQNDIPPAKGGVSSAVRRGNEGWVSRYGSNNEATSDVRLKTILFCFILFFGIIAFRMFQKQVLQFGYYKALAEQQYTTTKEIPASRGRIYIKDGYNTSRYFPVALNEPAYELLVVPKNVKDPKDLAEKIGPIIGQEIDEIYNKINNNKPYIPPLTKKLSKENAEKIQKLNLSGILLIPRSFRVYPEERLAGHVLGYVNADGRGQYGIEGYWDDVLKGESGTLTGERSSWGEVITSGVSSDAKNGSDLYLTIDRVVQYIISFEIKKAVKQYIADQGTVIVVDPKTGAILGMASYPDFNPNSFNKTSNVKLFNNPSVSESYEPGSVFKVVAMSVGLDTKKIKPETKETFGKCVEVGIETICTSTGKAYGEETMTDVLENSDNVGMVWMAQKLETSVFYKYLRDFGFNSYTGIDVNTEIKGDLLPASSWREINKATISFGQGIAVTPLQMVQALVPFANGGKLYQPYVVEKKLNADGEEEKTKVKQVRQVVSAEVADEIKDMMVSVVDNGFGRKAKISGYSVAGKTGTAEVADVKTGYSKDVNIISFGGFAPSEDPAFVMLVKLDHPRGAPWSSEVAAPVWKEIAQKLLHYFRIPPDR